ncbi:lipoprotein bor, partial [Escherichia coli]
MLSYRILPFLTMQDNKMKKMLFSAALAMLIT